MAGPIESASSSGPRLEMSGVSKRFSATVALDGVDLSVAPGEIHGLVGENGAGKSTLMKILSGALTPDAGTLSLDGRPYHPRSPLDARRNGVAMIYQELSLAPHMSVEDNIALGVEPSRFGVISRKRIRALTVEALRQLGHEDIPPDLQVSRLSVAGQQIVEIARALSIGCRVLILDEPTSSLAPQDVQKLFEVIRRLKESDHAIIYISHFIEEVRRIADRYTVLRDGKSVGTGSIEEVTMNDLIGMMVGRTVDSLYPRTVRTVGEAILEVKELYASSKMTSASLSLHRGEVLGVAGLLGAGRTELLRAIFGLDPVRKGSVKVGLCAGPASPVRRWMQGTGLVSEDRKGEGLALTLSLADNLTLSKLTGLGPAGLVFPGRQDRAASRWVKELDIRCAGPRQALTELSGGNQQKVALARLLHHDVDVFLLDEPTRGIDVGSKAQIYELIDRLAAGRQGKAKAVLMVSSYLPELLGVCDRIAVMCRGRLGPARPVKDLDEHKLMAEATGQENAA